MSGLITAMRMFETNQKVMTMQSDRMSRVISDLAAPVKYESKVQSPKSKVRGATFTLPVTRHRSTVILNYATRTLLRRRRMESSS